MDSFIDYLTQEKILDRLISYYHLDLKDNKESSFISELLNCLSVNRTSFDVSKSPIDTLGEIYEKFMDINKKKQVGEFFTPPNVVAYILGSAEYIDKNPIDDKKVIDISCGSGSFILQLVRTLINRLLLVYSKPKISDLTIQDAKNVVQKVFENLYGIDQDPIACILCQINIHYALFEVYKVIVCVEHDYVLPYFQIHNFNTLLLINSDFFDNKFKYKFDFVFGNPPYLFIRDISEDLRELIENSDFKTNNGQYDLYQLFIEIGISILKDQGYLGYIIPDSILALSNRSILRKYIFDATKIIEIYHSKPEFTNLSVSNVILILQRELDRNNREINEIKTKIITANGFREQKVVQKDIMAQNYQFLIHLDKKDSKILENLNNIVPKLKHVMNDKRFKIFLNRGVELGKSGKIIYCEFCRRYYPLPNRISNCKGCNKTLKKAHIENIIVKNPPDQEENNYSLFLYAINRYIIKDYKYIILNKPGINYKSPRNYEERVVIRQLNQNNLICAAFDKNLSFSSQSFYNLKVLESKIPEFNNLYLLGIINSTLLSFYFTKSFGSYKKLFSRILIEKLKNLPIKIPETALERQKAGHIIELIKEIQNSNEIDSDFISKIQNKIDLEVYDLYQISYENRNHIAKAIVSLQEKF